MQNSSPQFPWSETSFLRGLVKLVSEEGLQSLASGMNATLLRECLYSTIRMGAYEPILNLLNYQSEYPSPTIKYVSSLLSGALGAAIATPTDLIKIQFQSARPSQPLPYQTVLQGFRYILQHQGVTGLWKGSIPTISRAAVVTSSVIGSYDSIKNNLFKNYFHFKDGIELQFCCSLFAGVITTLASNPSMQIFSLSLSPSLCLSLCLCVCLSLSLSLSLSCLSHLFLSPCLLLSS
jgi:solute carrier family 25 (mitochondrial oxoglutarate transporter), member 11